VKILIVHQFYLFPGQPGGSRFNELAARWAAAGHEVEVAAGNHNYYTGETPEGLERGWTTRTTDGQVIVWRCYVPRTINRGYAWRAWAFFGFTLTSLMAALKAERPDVVITTSPPLTVAITGWLLTRLRFRRIPWVFEIRDLWPESAVTTGVLSARSPIARALYRLEKLACRSADCISVLSPAFRDDLVARGLAPASKIVFVPNGADHEKFAPASRNNDIRRSLGWGDRTVFLYAGAHGRANAVHQLVDAASRLRHRPDLLIATAGDGPERTACERSARDAGLDNVVFLGGVAKERMPDLVNAADVGVAVLQDNPTFKTVYPNKVFDYMACARPVLLAIDGAARRLVCDEAQAGVYAPAEQPQMIADAMVALADNAALRTELGTNGRRWVVTNAARPALADRYLRHLEALVVEPRPGRAQAVV
jgi:glycosyltransferase involved in cell wall biosynthesis